MNWFFLSIKKWQAFAKYLSLFLACCFLAISCRQSQPQPIGNQTAFPNVNDIASIGGGDYITIGTTVKPRTFEPAEAYEMRSLGLIYNLSDRLYTYAPGSTQILPQLATALPEISSDGLTYTIPLRKGVIFHDGSPFNAEAMAFSLRRFIKNNGKPAFLLSDIIDSINATSEYELTIKLKKPFTAFPSLLASTGTCAVSPKAYKIGLKKFETNGFVGTGPYQLGEYGSDEVKFEVFDNYWGEKPANKGINLQIYLNNFDKLSNALKTRSVDVTDKFPKPDQIRNLEQEANRGKWQIISSQASFATYILFNVRQRPLNQRLVRQAIAAFVNRPLINDRVLFGQAEPLYSIIPNRLDDTFDVSKPVFKDAYGDGNIEKAKQLLLQAGFSASNPLKLDVLYPNDSVPRELTAKALQDFAAQQMGGMLQFEVKPTEGADFFNTIANGKDHSIALYDWYPDFIDPDNYVQPFLQCTKGSVATGCDQGGSQTQGLFYYSDDMNKLIDQQRQELNPEKRKQIFAQIQDKLVEDVPLVPLWQGKNFVFAQKGITDVHINATQILSYRAIKKGQI